MNKFEKSTSVLPVNLTKPEPVDLVKHTHPEVVSGATSDKLPDEGLGRARLRDSLRELRLIEQEHKKSSPRRTHSERVIDWLMERWDDRPSFFELIAWGIPTTMITFAGYVAVADEVFDAHIARDMANVHVMKHPHGILDNIEQFSQQIIHDTGSCGLALEDGSGDC